MTSIWSSALCVFISCPNSALPPDVRQGFAPPGRVTLMMGCAPGPGSAPNLGRSPNEGQSPHQTWSTTAGQSPASHPPAKPHRGSA